MGTGCCGSRTECWLCGDPSLTELSAYKSERLLSDQKEKEKVIKMNLCICFWMLDCLCILALLFPHIWIITSPRGFSFEYIWTQPISKSLSLVPPKGT